MPIQICVWSERFSRSKKKENFVLFISPRLICRTYSWPEKPIPVACGVNFTKPEINLSYASAEIPQQWNSKTINCVIILRWQTTKGEIGVGKLWKSFGGSVQVVKNRKPSDQGAPRSLLLSHGHTHSTQNAFPYPPSGVPRLLSCKW